MLDRPSNIESVVDKAVLGCCVPRFEHEQEDEDEDEDELRFLVRHGIVLTTSRLPPQPVAF